MTNVVAVSIVIAVIATAILLLRRITNGPASGAVPLFLAITARWDADSPTPAPIRHSSEQRAAPVISARPLPPLLEAGPIDPPARTRPPVRHGAAAADPRLVDGHHQEPVPHAVGETVRFRRPGEEAVQILPGRLEVLAGETRLREIRFVRVPGQPLQLILGRGGGSSPQQIALSSPTVSRRHALFTFAAGCWKVRNLSRTNPLVVNDDELSDTAGERTLVDGDRLELGEVVLRFHETAGLQATDTRISSPGLLR